MSSQVAIVPRLICTVCVSFALLVAESRAERVGFHFQGALDGEPSLITLFGKPVQGDSLINGTFSFDTTVSGVDSDTGVRDFAQVVQGGFSLNIADKISLSASNFVVSVGNDRQRQEPPEPVDVFNIRFDRFPPFSNPTLLMNRDPWPLFGYFQLEFIWPANTFMGPDEPKLTADRPIVPSIFVPTAFVSGMDGLPKSFSINSISAVVSIPGDYNLNGGVDTDDYSEWKVAYGSSAASADGNLDGIVDAADYTVWRDVFGQNHAGTTAGKQIPEPSCLAKAIFGLIGMFSCSRGRLLVPTHSV